MGWGEVEFATPLGGECPPWPGKTLTMDEKKKKKNLPSEIYTAECLLFLFLSSFLHFWEAILVLSSSLLPSHLPSYLMLHRHPVSSYLTSAPCLGFRV